MLAMGEGSSFEVAGSTACSPSRLMAACPRPNAHPARRTKADLMMFDRRRAERDSYVAISTAISGRCLHREASDQGPSSYILLCISYPMSYPTGTQNDPRPGLMQCSPPRSLPAAHLTSIAFSRQVQTGGHQARPRLATPINNPPIKNASSHHHPRIAKDAYSCASPVKLPGTHRSKSTTTVPVPLAPNGINQVFGSYVLLQKGKRAGSASH